MQPLTLSSTLISEGDRLIACPDTAITITCSATQVSLLAWFSMPGSLVHGFVPNDYDTDDARVVKDSYTLTLVEATNVSESIGDLISDLTTLVNDITNGTIVTCKTLSTQKSLTVYKKGTLVTIAKAHIYYIDLFNMQVFHHLHPTSQLLTITYNLKTSSLLCHGSLGM